MDFVVQSVLRARFLVIAIAAAMMVFGVSRLRDMPVDLYPEFSPPYVQVQTEALGLSAEEVEGLITIPLEADLLNGVSWVQTISSDSLPGLSTIRLVFEPGTNLMDARQLVAERLTQVGGLPQVSKPPVMLQAPVVDQPGHADRAVLDRSVPHPDVGSRPLDDRAPPEGMATRTSLASKTSKISTSRVRPASFRRGPLGNSAPMEVAANHDQ